MICDSNQLLEHWGAPHRSADFAACILSDEKIWMLLELTEHQNLLRNFPKNIFRSSFLAIADFGSREKQHKSLNFTTMAIAK